MIFHYFFEKYSLNDKLTKIHTLNNDIYGHYIHNNIGAGDSRLIEHFPQRTFTSNFRPKISTIIELWSHVFSSTDGSIDRPTNRERERNLCSCSLNLSGKKWNFGPKMTFWAGFPYLRRFRISRYNFPSTYIPVSLTPCCYT